MATVFTETYRKEDYIPVGKRGWQIRCECFNCGYIWKTQHSSDITPDHLESAYVLKYVCKKCAFVNRDATPRGLAHPSYRFHGATTIERGDGSIERFVNNTILGTTMKQTVLNGTPVDVSPNKKQASIDRNHGNMFVSIWDSNYKKKGSLLRSIAEITDDEDLLSDDEYERGEYGD